MTISEMIALISLLFAFVTVVLNLRTSKKKREKEIEMRVTERTETNMKLDQIDRNVNEIKDTMKETKKEVRDLGERLAITDAKADKAHMRLDLIEEREKGWRKDHEG